MTTMLIVEILFVHQLLRMDWLNNLKQICDLIPSKLLNHVSTQTLSQVHGKCWRMNSGVADHAILQHLFITLGMTLKFS
jgi:hypothetical protein